MLCVEEEEEKEEEEGVSVAQDRGTPMANLVKFWPQRKIRRSDRLKVPF